MQPSDIRKKLRWLDPFTYVDILLNKYNPSHNPWIDQPVYFISAFIFAVLLYSFLGFLLNTPSPMVIVVSESMEPTLYRGDVIVLTGIPSAEVNAGSVTLSSPAASLPLASLAEIDYPTRTFSFENAESRSYSSIGEGDILVYQSQRSPEAIIHRAILKIDASDGVFIVTKGDNNQRIDQDCGSVVLNHPQYPCLSLYPLADEEINGKAILRIPWVGYVKLILFDDLPALITGRPLPSLQ